MQMQRVSKQKIKFFYHNGDHKDEERFCTILHDKNMQMNNFPRTLDIKIIIIIILLLILLQVVLPHQQPSQRDFAQSVSIREVEMWEVCRHYKLLLLLLMWDSVTSERHSATATHNIVIITMCTNYWGCVICKTRTTVELVNVHDSRIMNTFLFRL